MILSALRRAAVAASVLAAVVIPGSLPAQAAGTGVITGTITTPTGEPATDATVVAYLTKNGATSGVGWSRTDSEGHYEILNMEGGTYTLSYEAPNRPNQYYRQKYDFGAADYFSLAAGATATINEQLLPFGTIRGTIRDNAGQPVPDLPVDARSTEDGRVESGRTDSDGNYRIGAFPGTYVLSFAPVAGSYQQQYIPGTIDERSAGKYTVNAGAEVIADDTVLATGTLAGRFTDSAGNALADASVDVGNFTSSTATDGDGRFSLDALAGSYTVSFSKADRWQYYRGALNSEDATPVQVVGGQRVEITDSLLPTGSVRFTAVDAVTGTKISRFCVEGDCADTTGTVTLTRPQGTHNFDAYALDRLHFQTNVKDVAVLGGKTIDVTIRMRSGGAITTTIVDRATNKPVSDVCLAAFRPRQAREVSGYGYCSDPLGKITIGPLEPGDYRLFADPTTQKPTYGRQWVGASGGTGDERLAAAVTATAGKTATAPQVRLDKAGTITGRITSAATGSPLAGVGAALLTVHPGVGGSGEVTLADGVYTIPRLGPYEWPVLFEAGTFPAQWSGGTASRYTAQRIKVTAGGTTRYDMALHSGVTVRGTVKDHNGVSADGGWLLAHNDMTGDIMGARWPDTGTYQMTLLPGQSIYFSYDISFGGRYYSGLFPRKPFNPSSPLSLKDPYRTRITVPSTGELVVDVVVSR